MKGMITALVSLLFVLACVPCHGDGTPPSYVVRRAPGPITVDGRLDEAIWEQAPRMEFRDIATGGPSPWPGYAVMLWDDANFYVGFHIEDPDIWASLAKDSPEATAWPEQRDMFVMHNDGFAKLFFDPDGDGDTYAELHVNANNKVDDWYFVRPHHWIIGVDTFHEQPGNWHLEFSYEGLVSEVYIEGTLNEHKDIDKYWTLEMAFPWSCLRPITKGQLPPARGDVWRAHTGRVICNVPGGRHSYYTWPVIGLVDCHRLHRWGFIVFADDYDEFNYE